MHQIRPQVEALRVRDGCNALEWYALTLKFASKRKVMKEGRKTCLILVHLEAVFTVKVNMLVLLKYP